MMWKRPSVLLCAVLAILATILPGGGESSFVGVHLMGNDAIIVPQQGTGPEQVPIPQTPNVATLPLNQPTGLSIPQQTGSTGAGGRVSYVAVPTAALLMGPSEAAATTAPWRRALLQFDASQEVLIPAGNAAGTSFGASNTANIGLSSAPSLIRRTGALGGVSSAAASNSLSAADTLVVAGVRGSDNLAAGSGGGMGPGSGLIGSNRGYTSAGGKRRSLLQGVPTRMLQQAYRLPITMQDNPDIGTNANTGAISEVAPSLPRAQQGLDHALMAPMASAFGRKLLQRASVGAQQHGVGGTSVSLLGADPSASTQSRADVSAGTYGQQSGSSGGIPGQVINTGNIGARRVMLQADGGMQAIKTIPSDCMLAMVAPRGASGAVVCLLTAQGEA